VYPFVHRVIHALREAIEPEFDKKIKGLIDEQKAKLTNE